MLQVSIICHRDSIFFYIVKTSLMHTVKSVTINKNALTWQQLHWDLIFSFLREAVGVSWLTQIKKKNNVLYAVIWISSGEAQQTGKTDRHAGKNQIRFLCLTWWIILSGRFSSQRFFFFARLQREDEDKARSVKMGKCWGKWKRCYAPLTNDAQMLWAHLHIFIFL